jgi:integrase
MMTNVVPLDGEKRGRRTLDSFDDAAVMRLISRGFVGIVRSPSARGLSLRIGAATSKGTKPKWTWVARVSWEGRKIETTIGQFPDMKCVRAMSLVEEMRRRAEAGMNPMASITTTETFTLGDLIDRWATANRHKKRAAAYPPELRRNLGPLLGKPANLLLPDDVAPIVEDLLATKNATGQNVLSYLRPIVKWGIKRKWLDREMTLGIEAGERKVDEFYFTLSEVGQIVADMPQLQAHARRMLTFLMLSGCRTGEASEVRPGWVRWNEGYVAIPGEFTKNGNPHRIVITPWMDQLLREALAAHPGGTQPLFCGPRGGVAQGSMWMTDLVAWANARTAAQAKRLGETGWVKLHGFRKSLSTILGESGLPFDEVDLELAVNHIEGLSRGSRKNYQFRDPWPRLRVIQHVWAATCAWAGETAGRCVPEQERRRAFRRFRDDAEATFSTGDEP